MEPSGHGTGTASEGAGLRCSFNRGVTQLVEWPSPDEALNSMPRAEIE